LKVSRHVHQQFVDIAAGIPGRLADAIETAGPVTLKAQDEEPLSERLCRCVAGQQLSTKAASTIWNRVVASADGDEVCG